MYVCTPTHIHAWKLEAFHLEENGNGDNIQGFISVRETVPTGNQNRLTDRFGEEW